MSPDAENKHYYRPVAFAGLQDCQQCWHCGALMHQGRYWLGDHCSTTEPPCGDPGLVPERFRHWQQSADRRSAMATGQPGLAKAARHLLRQILQSDSRLAGGSTDVLEATILALLHLVQAPSLAPAPQQVALNGYQLSEALEFLASDRSPEQLQDYLSISAVPGGYPTARYTGAASGQGITLKPHPVYVRAPEYSDQ